MRAEEKDVHIYTRIYCLRLILVTNLFLFISLVRERETARKMLLARKDKTEPLVRTSVGTSWSCFEKFIEKTKVVIDTL